VGIKYFNNKKKSKNIQEEHMMHLKPNKNGTADVAEFSGFVSSKQNGIISLTKIVVAISIFLAVLMIVAK
jgi:hypothetical protein